MPSESMTRGHVRHASVTPLLFVGASPSPRAVPVQTAQEAVALVEQGKMALLPEGAWEEARKAVEMMSGSEQRAAISVRMAKVGFLG